MEDSGTATTEGARRQGTRLPPETLRFHRHPVEVPQLDAPLERSAKAGAEGARP